MYGYARIVGNHFTEEQMLIIARNAERKELEQGRNGGERMKVSIEPRKPTDRGGYYCMPLKVNVPTGHKDWKLTKCPECGAQCWELPLAEVAKAQGARGLCTMCALKKGVSRG